MSRHVRCPGALKVCMVSDRCMGICRCLRNVRRYGQNVQPRPGLRHLRCMGQVRHGPNTPGQQPFSQRRLSDPPRHSPETIALFQELCWHQCSLSSLDPRWPPAHVHKAIARPALSSCFTRCSRHPAGTFKSCCHDDGAWNGSRKGAPGPNEAQHAQHSLVHQFPSFNNLHAY